MFFHAMRKNNLAKNVPLNPLLGSYFLRRTTASNFLKNHNINTCAKFYPMLLAKSGSKKQKNKT